MSAGADTDDVDDLELDESDADETDEDPDDADDTDDGDDDETDEPAGKAEFDEAALLAKVESRIDRRITSLMNKLDAKLTGKTTRPGSKPAAEEPTVSIREARLAYKDYVSDVIKFESDEERELAADLSAGLIARKIAAGADDEDEIGRDVAKAVAARITGLRKHYETRTRSKLRRDGVLPDQKGGQGSTAGRAGGAKTRSELQQGAALAAARHTKPAQ